MSTIKTEEFCDSVKLEISESPTAKEDVSLPDVVPSAVAGVNYVMMLTVHQWKNFQRRQNKNGITYNRNSQPSMATVLEDLIHFPPCAVPLSDAFSVAAALTVPGAVPVAVLLAIPQTVSVPHQTPNLVAQPVSACCAGSASSQTSAGTFKKLKTWKEFKSFKNKKNGRGNKRLAKKLYWKALRKRINAKVQSSEEVFATVPAVNSQLPGSSVEAPAVDIQVPASDNQSLEQVIDMEIEIKVENPYD